MDVLTAATIFYNYTKFAQTQQDYSKSKLIELATTLADPNAIQNPNANTIRTALISTLVQEVNNTTPRETYPITRPESKTDVRNLYGLVKVFYTNLTKSTDQTVQLSSAQMKTKLTNLISDFQKVSNAWQGYSSKYLDGMIDQLTMDKAKAGQNQQQDYQNRILFWKEIIKRISETISNIQAELTKQLSGNPNNPEQSPLQSTPV